MSHSTPSGQSFARQREIRPPIPRSKPTICAVTRGNISELAATTYAKRSAHKGVWVEPKLLAEIEYRAKSAEGKVRHPFFKGLREDL